MIRLLQLTLVAVLAAGVLSAADTPTTKVKEKPADALKVTKVEPMDLVYLGAERPAVFRLHVTIDGKSAMAKWDAYLEKVFNFLDRNKSKGLDRTEMDRAPTVQLLTQFMIGNPYIYTYGRQPAAKISFETVDTDRNGKITLDEFRTYYRPLVPPITIQPSYNYYANANDAMTERLFKVLDANRDDKLSKAELAKAAELLAKYDDNDDELISVAELSQTNNQYGYSQVAQPRMTRPGTPTANPTLIMIPKDESGKRKTHRLKIVRDIMTRYDKDKDGKLSREEVGFSKELFKKLDRNKDGYLNVLELTRWTENQPDGEFTIPLGDASKMAAMKKSGAMKGPAAKTSSMIVTMDNVRITVVPVGGQVYVYDYSTYFTNMFDQLDKDKTGYITRKQVATNQQYIYLRSILDFADLNNDGRLTKAELKGYLELVKAGLGTQLTLSLNSNGQGLFEALDANRDGQLSVRELRTAWSRLEEFDRNKDGAISKKEFPQQYTLAVGRSGSYYAGNQVNSRRNGTGIAAPTRGPLWFRKMDRNGDGDVSRKEWLGSKTDFDKIDKDKDGLISLEEANAYDTLIRKTQVKTTD